VRPCPKKEIGCMRKKNEGVKTKVKKEEKKCKDFFDIALLLFFLSFQL
jgi:hypothetical protein